MEEHITRITGVPSAQAGLYVKIAYHFTRRSIAKLTGRETDRMIEPLQPRARHRPGRLQRRHGVAIPVAHP